MRSAPAPSALLLLLLLLPPPSLAQEGDIQAMTIMNSSAEPNQISTVPPATLSSTVRAGTDAGGMTDSDKVVENKTQMNTDAGVSDSVGTSVATLETPTTAKGALQLTSSPSDSTATRAPADSTAAPTQANSASDVSLPKENATSSLVVSDNGLQMPTSVPTKPATTIIQDKAQSPVTRLAPEEGSTPTYPTRGVSHPTITAPALSISTSLAPIGSGTPSSVSKDGDQRTVTASGSSPTAGPTSMPSGSPSTQSTVSLDTSSELRPGSSLKPSITETPTLSARSLSPDTMWPMDTSSSPETVPSTQAPAGSSTPLTSAAPHDIHPSPSPTSESQRGFFQVHCDPPERFSKQLLVLNFTKTRLCNGSHHDDKLETVLCQAAKANFNPAHDQCHIWLAPVPEVQGLAVKEIRIQTKLLPQDMYESLKDKWDTLKEIGVSHMQLGEQGPPEEAEDRFSMPLIITIICMASFLLLVAVLYGCCHQRLSQRKDQQRLTEELQTVENGYHDNPTLEVMETSSEMQEKKVVSLNGELGDSWIVPLDNLIKDDLDEEEDTHL